MTKIIKTDSYTQDKALGLEEVAAPAPIAAATTGFLYTRDDAGSTELYYKDAADREVQITALGSLDVPPVDVTKLVNPPVEVYLTTNASLDALGYPNTVLQFSDSVSGNIAELTNTESSVFFTGTAPNVNAAGAAIETVCIGYNAKTGGSPSEGNVVIGAAAGFSTQAADDSTNNIFIGKQAGYSSREAYNCVAVGTYSMENATNIEGSVFVGSRSGRNVSTGGNNVFVGFYSGEGIAGSRLTGSGNASLGYKSGNLLQGVASNNTLIGSEAGDAITSGSGTTAVGYQAGSAVTTNTGGTYVGYQAGLAATGANNTVVGYQAGDSVTTGAKNTILGAQAGAAISSSNDNVFIGYNAGATATGGPQICIGYDAGNAASNASGKIAIGWEAGKGAGGANSVFIGYQAGTVATGGENVFIGTSAGLNATNGTGCVCVGRDAGKLLTTNVNNVVLIGQEAGDAINNATASGSVAIGYQAASLLASAAGGTYVGYRAGYQTTGANNTVVGYEAAYSASLTGTDNVAVGYRSLYNAGTAANYNTVIGSTAGDAITGGDNNTLIGYGAGGAITTSPDNVCIGSGTGGAMLDDGTGGVVLIGKDAGATCTGGGNVCIGLSAGSGLTSGINNVIIGRSAGASRGAGNAGTFIGYAAGSSSTGVGVTALGYQAGYNAGAADSGVYVGTEAGYATTGSQCVVIGREAWRNCTSGTDNTVIGYHAGYAGSGTTSYNTIIGSGAANGVLTLGGLVAIGYNAGNAATTGLGNTYVGYNSGVAATSGTYNTLLGYSSGNNITDGNNNILIGYNAGDVISTGDGNIIIGPIAGIADAQRTFKVGYHATNKPILSGVSYDSDISGGSNDSALTSNVTTFTIYDWKTDVEQFRASFGKLSTYGETSPDVEVGGLCLMVNDDTFHVLSLKENGMNHGCTTGFTSDADTWGYIKHKDSTTGGLLLAGISNGAAGVDGQGIKLFSAAKTVTDGDPKPTTTYAGMEVVVARTNGVNVEKFTNKENVFGVRNYTDNVFVVTAGGLLYAGSSSVGVLDVEDDIKLVQSFSTPQANPYYDRLKEIGVITDGGMMCLNNAQMLSIGAIGQLFNVIRGLAKRLGVSEDELYALAKQY